MFGARAIKNADASIVSVCEVLDDPVKEIQEEPALKIQHEHQLLFLSYVESVQFSHTRRKADALINMYFINVHSFVERVLSHRQ